MLDPKIHLSHSAVVSFFLCCCCCCCRSPLFFFTLCIDILYKLLFKKKKKNCSLCAVRLLDNRRQKRGPCAIMEQVGRMRLFCLGFDQTSNARLPIGSRDFQSLFDSTAEAISKDGRDLSSREFAHEITRGRRGGGAAAADGSLLRQSKPIDVQSVG